MSWGSRHPQFGAIRTHVRSKPVRMQGLGSLDSGVGTDLILEAQPLTRTLSDVSLLIDQAVASGAVDEHTVQEWSARYDALNASYERLIDRAAAAAAAGGDTEAAWVTESDRLLIEVQALIRDVSSMSASYARANVTKVALWTGAAVLGVVGTLLTVRWYVNRKKRR